MIRVERVIGNSNKQSIHGLEVDIIDIDWFDTAKTIIRKKTRCGRELGIRKDSTPLEEGDIVYRDHTVAIVVEIKPTDCIVFKPKNYRDMGVICFEIGNKHIPIFINEAAEVIVAYENPLFHLLQRFGYEPKRENRKLLRTHALKVNKHTADYHQRIKIKKEVTHEPLINLVANQ